MSNAPAVRSRAVVLACMLCGVILVTACRDAEDGGGGASGAGAGPNPCDEITLPPGMMCQALALHDSVVVEGGSASVVVLSAGAGSDTITFTRDTALGPSDAVVVSSGLATMRLNDSVVVEGGNRARTIISAADTGAIVAFLRQEPDSL